MICEVEGGGKLATIVPEGTQVKKGDEVARFDTDMFQKGINEQEVKWETGRGQGEGAPSELEVQKNKDESEIAKADLALTLAKIDLEAYQDRRASTTSNWKSERPPSSWRKKELKEAEDNLEFTRGLVKKGFAQMEQLRVMELTVESKKDTVRQQEADLKVFEKFTKSEEADRTDGPRPRTPTGSWSGPRRARRRPPRRPTTS